MRSRVGLLMKAPVLAKEHRKIIQRLTEWKERSRGEESKGQTNLGPERGGNMGSTYRSDSSYHMGAETKPAHTQN